MRMGRGRGWWRGDGVERACRGSLPHSRPSLSTRLLRFEYAPRCLPCALHLPPTHTHPPSALVRRTTSTTVPHCEKNSTMSSSVALHGCEGNVGGWWVGWGGWRWCVYVSCERWHEELHDVILGSPAGQVQGPA